MTEKPPYYLTSAIAYVNGEPHIGHAYEAVAIDTIARWQRLAGYDLFFQTGTDEHGQKVESSAQKAGMETQMFADKNAKAFREMMDLLEISYDGFIRTTDPAHYRSVRALWGKMEANGDLYLSSYSGWYSVRDEAYFTEGELTRQEDGSYLAPSGSPVEWVDEPSWFFRLSSYQDRLLEFYDRIPDFVLPSTRMNEVRSFVTSGLNDLSVSRTTFSWGVPVPGNPDHVMYVWLDALTNYISALGYPDVETNVFQRYWSNAIHVVGKDIVRFHAVYWPAFLMSGGIKLPRHVIGHGFLNVEGVKMSKSLGNVLLPRNLADTYGVEGLRYFLVREISFGQDGSVSDEAVRLRVNSDLANNWGNLAQRCLTLALRHADGKVPTPAELTQEDDALIQAGSTAWERMATEMETFQLHRALEAAMDLVGAANRYVDQMAPWKLAKEGTAESQDRLMTVLFVSLETIARAALLLSIAIPKASHRVMEFLSLDLDEISLLVANSKAGVNSLPIFVQPGAVLRPPEPLFPRLEVVSPTSSDVTNKGSHLHG